MRLPLLFITHTNNQDVMQFYLKQFMKFKWDQTFDPVLPGFHSGVNDTFQSANILYGVKDDKNFAKYLLNLITQFQKEYPDIKHIALSADDFIPKKQISTRLKKFIKTSAYRDKRYVLLNRRPSNLGRKAFDILQYYLFDKISHEYPAKSLYKASLNIAIWEITHLSLLLRTTAFDNIWQFERLNDHRKGHFYLVGNNIRTNNFLEKGEYNFGMVEWGEKNGFSSMVSRRERRISGYLFLRHKLGILKNMVIGPRY